MSVTIRHSSTFKPYKVKFPINWLVNPYNNKNWLHNFNSLRWLVFDRDSERKKKVLYDFYQFHCIKRKRNPYYDEMRGDHTAAIRLGVLIEIKKDFVLEESFDGVEICRKLVVEEIKNLQREKLYRVGHNHGLMVDLSLLDLVVDYPEYRKIINLDLILERSKETLEAMWHNSGLTKEHSVSYQEYNLPLTIEYFNKIKILGLKSNVSFSLEKVVSESKRFLGYVINSNGEYLPLGDSFRSPNEKILNKVFGNGGSKRPKDLLMPYSDENGAYYNDSYFIYRGELASRPFHFAFTCCWNSQHHKKNDELSFALSFDNEVLFDVPGWSAFSSPVVNDFLSTEYANSTVMVLGESYSDKKNAKLSQIKSEVIVLDLHKNIFQGRHGRISGLITNRRVEIKKESILIDDFFEEGALPGKLVLSRFILGKGVKVKFLNDRDVMIYKDSCPMMIFKNLKGNGFFQKGFSKVISSDKHFLDDVEVLDYYRYGLDRVTFELSGV